MKEGRHYCCFLCMLILNMDRTSVRHKLCFTLNKNVRLFKISSAAHIWASYCTTTCMVEPICGIHRGAHESRTSTYRTAQQDGGLGDHGRYDWLGTESKTMSGKHRGHFYLKRVSVSMFSIPSFHFYSWWLLLKGGPFQMKAKVCVCVFVNDFFGWINQKYIYTQAVSHETMAITSFFDTFPNHLAAFKTKSESACLSVNKVFSQIASVDPVQRRDKK